MNVLVVCDNERLLNIFMNIVNEKKYESYYFYYFSNQLDTDDNISYIDFKKTTVEFYEKFNLALSLHSKQLFPKKLLEVVRSVNIHPGFNPYNRGWYPHVFSMIDGQPVGVTIHEIDSTIDNGPIIYQEQLEIREDEISSDIYNRLLELEEKMLSKYLINILNDDYAKKRPSLTGNINYKSDFKSLCEIDLNKQVTMKEAIAFFKAMSFENINNAYYIDNSGEKIFVSISLSKEK